MEVEKHVSPKAAAKVARIAIFALLAVILFCVMIAIPIHHHIHPSHGKKCYCPLS